MIYAINYADRNYATAQHLNSWSAKHIVGVDKVYEYTPDDIDRNFYEKHKDILKSPRGGGYWLWKPYFINKTLELINNGDIITYCDSGAMYVKSVKKLIPYFEEYKQDIIFSSTPYYDRNWCKPKIFNSEKEHIEQVFPFQYEATWIIVKKSSQSAKIIQEWLDMCCEPENLIDDQSYNFPCIEHRHDQALFSIVCKRYNLKPIFCVSDRYLFHRIIAMKQRYIEPGTNVVDIAMEYYEKLYNKRSKLYIVVHHLSEQRGFLVKALKYYIKSIAAVWKGWYVYNRERKRRSSSGKI